MSRTIPLEDLQLASYEGHEEITLMLTAEEIFEKQKKLYEVVRSEEARADLLSKFKSALDLGYNDATADSILERMEEITGEIKNIGKDRSKELKSLKSGLIEQIEKQTWTYTGKVYGIQSAENKDKLDLYSPTGEYLISRPIEAGDQVPMTPEELNKAAEETNLLNNEAKVETEDLVGEAP